MDIPHRIDTTPPTIPPASPEGRKGKATEMSITSWGDEDSTAGALNVRRESQDKRTTTLN